MDPSIEKLLELLFHLAIAAPGAAALIVILVNIGKALKWVKDDTAQLAVNILNVVFAVVIGVLATWFPTVNVGSLDALLESLAGTLTVFLPVLVILVKWIAPLFYGAVRGVPLLGYTHSK